MYAYTIFQSLTISTISSIGTWHSKMILLFRVNTLEIWFMPNIYPLDHSPTTPRMICCRLHPFRRALEPLLNQQKEHSANPHDRSNDWLFIALPGKYENSLPTILSLDFDLRRIMACGTLVQNDVSPIRVSGTHVRSDDVVICRKRPNIFCDIWWDSTNLLVLRLYFNQLGDSSNKFIKLFTGVYVSYNWDFARICFLVEFWSLLGNRFLWSFSELSGSIQ